MVKEKRPFEVNVNGREIDVHHKQKVLQFMCEVFEEEKAKQLYWYAPGNLKHLCEAWLRNNGTHAYVGRDEITATAILMGLPIKEVNTYDRYAIGLKITKGKYHNLFHNLHNKKFESISEAVNTSTRGTW